METSKKRGCPGSICSAAIFAAVVILSTGVLLGQGTAGGRSSFHTGKDVYQGGCITCHGPMGDGAGPAARTLARMLTEEAGRSPGAV